jgi:hypothetical protein
MPGYRRFLEAWAKHPQRELLDERKGETDETGAALGAVRELHEDGWVECKRHFQAAQQRVAVGVEGVHIRSRQVATVRGERIGSCRST